MNINVYFSGTPKAFETYPSEFSYASFTDKSSSDRVVCKASYHDDKSIYHYVRYDMKTNTLRTGGNFGVWLELEGKQLKKELNTELVNFFKEQISLDYEKSPFLTQGIISKNKNEYKFEINNFEDESNVLDAIQDWIKENFINLFSDDDFLPSKKGESILLIPDYTKKENSSKNKRPEKTIIKTKKDAKGDQSIKTKNVGEGDRTVDTKETFKEEKSANTKETSFSFKETINKYAPFVIILLIFIGYQEYRFGNLLNNDDGQEQIEVGKDSDDSNVGQEISANDITDIWKGDDKIKYVETSTHHKYFLNKGKFIRANQQVHDFNDCLNKLVEFVMSSELDEKYSLNKDDIKKLIITKNDKNIPLLKNKLNKHRESLNEDGNTTTKPWITANEYPKLFNDLLIFEISKK